MYKIENLNDKYIDVAKYLKAAKDDHITIAASNGKVKIPKDLLLLTSPMMRDILTSYPVSLEPLVIIPDESINCEAVEKLTNILLNKCDYVLMNDEVRYDIGVFMDLIDIDQTLFRDTKAIADIEVKVENQVEYNDLVELVKEEGEDECLMDAINEMERLLECETTNSGTKKEKSEGENVQKVFGEEEDSVEKPFSCEVCDQRFKLRDTLNMHKVKVHDKPYPFYCADCGQGYLKKKRLREHREIIHLGLRKFQCQQCSKTFTREYCLKMHMVTHTKEAPYKCELCGKRYLLTGKQKYKKHIEKCHQNEQYRLGGQYACTDCEEKFSKKWQFNRHQKRAHNIEKPFSCELCDENFQLRDTLSTHNVKVHDKPYPYYCAECGKGYVKKDRLREHREIIHLGLRKYQCQQCSKTFTREYCLKMHAVTHTNEFPFKCDSCGKRYKETSRQRYKQHIEKCHQNKASNREENIVNK